MDRSNSPSTYELPTLVTKQSIYLLNFVTYFFTPIVPNELIIKGIVVKIVVL
jgi:hypothetical protein